MVPPSAPASPNMIEDRMNFHVSNGGKTSLPITTQCDKLRSCGQNVPQNSISAKPEDHLSREEEEHCESPQCELDLSDKCSEMNKKNSEAGKEPTQSSIPPVRRVRANHRRNLSLDFRAMGIELPPLPEVIPPATVTSPPRRLANIPEHNTALEIAPQQPAITPKIKHVVRRILSRRIN